jgi:hypothetical protein
MAQEDWSEANTTHGFDLGKRPPMADTILPIPIRENLTVYIQGLPDDMTEVEADKIARVVRAFVAPTDPTRRG